jgi:methionine biosynthesis protein MetW
MNFSELSRLRADLAFIAHWVAPGSHVLDLGCGDGVMLDYLQTDKSCSGYGIEIDDAKIPECVERGVSVIQQDMESGLAIFKDGVFDTVLCLSALQMMKNVEGVLRDIARVGGEAIVSFPNFAYWPHRLALLRGRMPVSKILPYEWYDTPNLRCATHSSTSRRWPMKSASKCSNAWRSRPTAASSRCCRTGAAALPCFASAKDKE